MKKRQDEETLKVDIKERKTPAVYGRGLDIGTGNFCIASYEDGNINTKLIRDAFCIIEADKHKLKMLNDRNEKYILRDNKIYLIGEKAKVYANIFGNKYQLRRPLAKGVLNPDEKDSHFVVREILKSLLGEPKVNNEIVYFSVPAEPLDATFNQIFHENKFIALLESLGYEGKPINEAKCIMYSEASNDNYSALCLSFGAGMMNCSLSFEGDTSDLEFSLTKPGKNPDKKESYGCGDWIDINAAMSIGKEIHEIIDIKEDKSLNLIAPETEEHFAITVYYKNMIKYLLANLKNGIDNLQNVPKFSEKIPVVLSGGTSLAKGFKELFEKEFYKYKWPFEVKQIRLASDQLRAVATGALIAAIAEYED